MSRIRTIKPEFWSSEQIVECSTNARLLFIGMWNFCDAAGRHSFSPKQLKAQVFPSDDFSVDEIAAMLDELSTNDLITVYEVENKQYLQVTGWHHQKIDREITSKMPGPFDDHSMIIRRSPDDSSPMEGKGREGKEKQNINVLQKVKAVRKFKHELPEGWVPNSNIADYGRQLGLSDGQIASQTEAMRLWAKANKILKVDWGATLQGFYRSYAEKHGVSSTSESPKNGSAVPFFAERDTPQGLAWWDYTFRKTGKYPPTNSKGGWYFPTEYPPREEAVE